VSASEPLTPLNTHTVFPTFLILDPTAPPASFSSDASSSLTSSTYVGGQWIPIKAARENFKLKIDESMIDQLKETRSIPRGVMSRRLEGLDAEKGFDTYVSAWARLDPAETHETQNTVDAVRSNYENCWFLYLTS